MGEKQLWMRFERVSEKLELYFNNLSLRSFKITETHFGIMRPIVMKRREYNEQNTYFMFLCPVAILLW